MYIHLSPTKTATRVRILEKLLVDGKRVTRLVEHIGSARNETELAVLRLAAQQRLAVLRPQASLLDSLDQATYDPSRLSITHSYAYGLWHLVGSQYDALGLPTNLLKYLVLARIARPKSKLTTARYLGEHLNRSVDVTTIYQFMDTLDKDSLMSLMLAHAQARTKATTGTAIAVVFYDVTTLYFETDEEDEEVTNLKTGEILPGLRKKGYSKDHRFDLPQVVVGLTIDHTGFPLDFQVYEGNTYEGHTLMDGVRSVQAKLSLKPSDLTVVADAGMLSQKNTDALEEAGYSYIVGARIRSMSKAQTDALLAWDYAKHGTYEVSLNQTEQRRLIVTYSDKRAKRSQQNRNRLVRKLQAKLDRGQVVKKSKYVLLDDDTKLTGSIDQTKLMADARFDGLKGYVTNTSLMADEVIAQYHNLWKVEKSFRMSKSDLRTRPVFHFKRKRVLAHLLICVCSLAVLREFERQIVPMEPVIGLSVALEETLAIRQYTLRIPNQPAVPVFSELTAIQQSLLGILGRD